MSLILNIDTALDEASVCLSEKGIPIQLATCAEQKDQGSWLHNTIRELLKAEGKYIQALNAVAVTIGPGSYTGLRLGLSAAKGICYALNIPLITIGTLDLLASVVKARKGQLICPMIDARRMEVFTAIFDHSLQPILPPHALILDGKSFGEFLSSSKIIFVGNGSIKFSKILSHPRAIFSPAKANSAHLGQLSYPRFQKKIFADMVYSEPLYVKEFHTIEKRIER